MSYCTLCGEKLPEKAAFCPKCGQKVIKKPARDYAQDYARDYSRDYREGYAGKVSQGRTQPGKRSNKGLIILVLALTLVLLGVVLGLIVYTSNPDYRIKRQLSLGERYLSDLDYERAIAAYEEALEIDPHNVEALEGLGDTYESRADTEAVAEAPDWEAARRDHQSARDYYQRALENIPDSDREAAERIEQKVDSVEEDLSRIDRESQTGQPESGGQAGNGGQPGSAGQPENGNRSDETAEISSSEWASVFYDYVTGVYVPEEYSEYYTYNAIYINGDSIPEIYVDTGITAAGAHLLTYNPQTGEVNRTILSLGVFRYIERANRFHNWMTRMGGAMDTIGWIADGTYEVSVLEEGTIYDLDNAYGGELEIGDDGYYLDTGNEYAAWNGEELSTTEYVNRLKHAFDRDASIVANDSMMDGEAFLKFLQSKMNAQEGVSENTGIPSAAVEYNNHFYCLYTEEKVSSFDEAVQFCKDKGGHLATITSMDENDFLFSYIKQQGTGSAYFGLSDAEKEGTWEWCTGEPVSFLNWHDGEPNGENAGEDFAMFYYKFKDGTWNDGDFGGRTVNGGEAFICEWE